MTIFHCEHGTVWRTIDAEGNTNYGTLGAGHALCVEMAEEIERLRDEIYEIKHPLPANGEGWDKPPTIHEFPATIQGNAT